MKKICMAVLSVFFMFIFFLSINVSAEDVPDIYINGVELNIAQSFFPCVGQQLCEDTNVMVAEQFCGYIDNGRGRSRCESGGEFGQ